jgi:voltage-gated potassium channel
VKGGVLLLNSDTTAADASRTRALRRERWQLLARLHRGLEPLFVALSAIWIGLVVVELAGGGLPPTVELLVYVIWGLFVVQFGVGLLIAPSRVRYLRRQWLTALSLILPAFRVLRLASFARLLGASRIVRSISLLRVLTSVNRGLAALGRTAHRRGVGFVIAATAIVLFVGAAGMAYFESPAALVPAGTPTGGEGLGNYADALWWTAFAMTTGAFTQPETGEGRLLGWALSVYGLAVFGYLTAILASHFVGRDIADHPYPPTARAAARGTTD